jgi:plastocyanin
MALERLGRSAGLAAALFLGGCSTYQSTPAAPSRTGATPSPDDVPVSIGATISITPSGFVPLEVSITVGQAVRFVNNDTRPHDLVGGPDPAHPDCREIDVAGFLSSGQTRQTRAFPTARTCQYHDHAAIDVPGFQGTIIIR